jgi:hypothetical protein
MMGAAISAAITTHLGMSSPNIVQSSFDGLRVHRARQRNRKGCLQP